ncbi:MAG: Hsp20/alpha crystallin family protein [Allomuricauda sp.]|nr:MAG: Hsp20/alpha crystallin family protein [Allomuricauda sp.]
MSIVKRNNLLFPSLMNEFFKPDWFGGMETLNTTVPAVNIKENEKDFELELAIPGFKKDDFNIEVDENILTISSEVTSENHTNENKYTRREFSYNAFKRAFTLPETIDDGKINANYEAGVLRLTLPKREEALPKPKRMIAIS